MSKLSNFNPAFEDDSFFTPEELFNVRESEFKRVFNEYLDDMNESTSMFPNGRDFDAEDEDFV